MTVSDDWIYDQLWRVASMEGPAVELSALDQETTHRFLAIARIQGVLGLVLHKLRNTPSPHAQTWDIAQRAWKGEVVQSMRVRRHAQAVLRLLDSVGIPAGILKGTDFADHLFTEPRLRPTLDVDVLVPRDRWHDAVHMLETAGHREKAGQPPMFLSSGVVAERSWVHPLADTVIEVDLHWNLVHLPTFRRQATLEYADLDWQWRSDGQGELTAASRLIIAAVHALYHHQFDRLMLLTDLQRASRKIQRRDQQQAVRLLMARTHTHLAVDVGLQIAARFLEDPEIGRLRESLLGVSGSHPLPQGLYDDARRNLRSIRHHYLSPGRQRIRQWLQEQPPRPQPGWEMRPATSAMPVGPANPSLAQPTPGADSNRLPPQTRRGPIIVNFKKP